ncbi:putative endopeptidase p60 [Lachnospiraceae bacterium]|nr:putative endopeptidase p60 [Lachnospiraceae bacterium]
MRLAGRAAWKAVGLASSVLSDDGADRQQEDMEEEALHGAKQIGERVLRLSVRGSSRRMQKWNRRAGEEIPGAKREKSRKFYQKKQIKKAYVKARRGEKTAGVVAKEAGTLLGRAKSIAAEVFRKKKGLLIAAVFLLLLFLFFSAGISSCSAMVQGTASPFIGTTYPSEDEDIYAVEEAYRELEEALDEQINTVEVTHPGYDEYRYQVDEIAHNPYQLISFLTVIYEEFTYDLLRDILPELFAEQYRLTVEEMTETRTRTETRTVMNPLTGEETEEDVEVEYEWHVLCICLTNKGFDTVARGRLTPEQTELYTAYNLTYGNRSYLFDITGIPVDNAGSAEYEIPEEALSDEQFARMIREAEKYLGMAYVWGGASPETGFDCSGFVSWVINNSGNGWDVGRQTAEGLRRNCAAVSPSEARPGDLVFFQGTYNTSGASHVGIYVGNGMMIHAGNPIKYSNINTPYWQGHLLSYGRIR